MALLNNISNQISTFLRCSPHLFKTFFDRQLFLFTVFLVIYFMALRMQMFDTNYKMTRRKM
jgi:hypothetical protein